MHARDATARLCAERLRSGLAECHRVLYPKDREDEYRVFALLDPFDEIAFRVLVGRAALGLNAALGPEVTSARLLTPPPAWSITSSRSADFKRRRSALSFIRSNEFVGLGVIDVKNYYPSVDLEKLECVVADHVGAAAARHIGTWVAGFADWNVGRLPIGPEASAPLGTSYLTGVDAILRKAGVSFERHTDDFRFFLRRHDEWQLVLELTRSALSALGLEPHPEKVKHITTRGIAEREVSDAVIESLTRIQDHDVRAAAASAVLLEEAGRGGPRSRRRVRFTLGVLAARGDERIVRRLQAHPGWLRAEPRAWGRFLKVMAAQRKADPAWLLDLAQRNTGAKAAPAGAAAVHALAATAIPADFADPLDGLAQDVTVPMSLRTAAAEAYGQCKSVKVAHCADRALEAGPNVLKRAYTLALRHQPPSRARSRSLRKLRSQADICRPSVAWIEGR